MGGDMESPQAQAPQVNGPRGAWRTRWTSDSQYFKKILLRPNPIFMSLPMVPKLLQFPRYRPEPLPPRIRVFCEWQGHLLRQLFSDNPAIQKMLDDEWLLDAPWDGLHDVRRELQQFIGTYDPHHPYTGDDDATIHPHHRALPQPTVHATDEASMALASTGSERREAIERWCCLHQRR